MTLNLPLFLSDATSPSLNPNFNIFFLVKPQFCTTFSTLSLLRQRYLFLNKTQIRFSPICAKNNKRRSGYREINRFVVDTVCLFATKVDVFPEPFATLIKEYGGGKGGGVRFFKGFGDGGFFKKNKNLSFLGFVLVFGIVMWLGLGKRLEFCDLCVVIMVLIIFGGLISNCWKRGFKDWVQGVCLIASIGFLGLKKESLPRLMKGFGEMINSRKRKRRAT